MKHYNKNQGQSLIEVVVAIVLGGILISISANAVVVTLNTNSQNNTSRIAAAQLQELTDNIRSIAASDWNFFYNIASKGISNPYYLDRTDGTTYTQSFTGDFTAEVTYDSVPHADPDINQGIGPAIVFTSSTVGYVFYIDAGEVPQYKKTSDGGITWGSPVAISAKNAVQGIAVWYDRWTPGDLSGNRIYIQYHDTNVAGPQAAYFKWLDTSDDSLSIEIQLSGDMGSWSEADGAPFITKASDGDLYSYVSGRDIRDVYVSTNGGSNWSGTSVTFLDDRTDNGAVVPLLNGDVMALWHDRTTDTLRARKRTDAGAWDGADTVVATNVKDDTWQDMSWGVSVYKTAGDLYVAINDNPTTNPEAATIETYFYDESAGSWTPRANVITGTDLDMFDAKVAIDDTTGDVYVAYLRGWSSSKVYYKKSTDGMLSWGNEQVVSSETDDLRSLRITAVKSGKLFAMWVNDDIRKGVTNKIVSTNPEQGWNEYSGTWFADEEPGASQGGETNYGSPSITADDSGTGSVVWATPGNVSASDDARADASPISTQTSSHYLKATNFGFSIPGSATVDGIEVRIDKNDGGGNAVDSAVRIVKNGIVGSTNKASGSNWPDSDSYVTYGSSVDKWGETWTPTDINSTNFGVAVSVTASTGITAADIDHIQIKIHYTEPQPQTDTGWKSPTNTGIDFNQWTNPTDAYSSNNIRSYSLVENKRQSWSSFSLGVPGGATIDGIEVSNEGYTEGTTPVQVKHRLSWDLGVSYTSQKSIYPPVGSGNETTTIVGSASDTWGRTWTVSELGDSNFLIWTKNETGSGSNYPNIDHIQAKVFYTPAPVQNDSGWVSPVTGVDDASVGSVAWANPGNIILDDSNRASASSVSSINNSHYLKVTNFGFSVPVAATIDGIEVEIEKTDLGDGNGALDNRIRIVKGGAIGSTDRSNGSNWPDTDAYVVYGTGSDLWGETWTPADINATNFGVAVSSKASSGISSSEVDHIRIKVHYTAPGPSSNDVYHQTDTASSDSLSFYETDTFGNLTYSARVLVKSSAGYAGLVFRAVDTENFYLWRIDTVGNTATLFKKESSAYTQLATYSVPGGLNNDTWYTLKVQVSDDNIIGYLDSIERVNISDATFGNDGYIGFRTYSSEVYFDDVNASDLLNPTLTFQVTSGQEDTDTENFTLRRYFYIENVTRDAGGDIAPGEEDPSTQKITTAVDWIRGSQTLNTYQNVFYLTRHRNSITQFTDWVGGSGAPGPITAPTNSFFSETNMDFSTTPGSVSATSTSADLISSTFDTQITNGAAFNSIMWLGTPPGGGETVKFQFASSNCSNGKTNPPSCDDAGNWEYIGPDGSAASYYTPTGPDNQAQLKAADHKNRRYYRYKIEVESTNPPTSQIDDVIVSWSP